MYINYLIICAILLISGYFLKYNNRLQLIDKRENKNSLDQLKLMKDLGYIFLIFGWIYLILAAICIFLPDLNLGLIENLIPFLFLISILLLFIIRHRKKQVFNSKKIFILIGALTLIIFGFNIASDFLLSPNEISVSDSNLSIKGIYGIDVNINDIDRVEFVESIHLYEKISGIKTNKAIKGEFFESNLGEVTVFLENENNVVEVFLKNNKIICINFRDKAKTEMFYEILKLKIK